MNSHTKCTANMFTRAPASVASPGIRARARPLRPSGPLRHAAAPGRVARLRPGSNQTLQVRSYPDVVRPEDCPEDWLRYGCGCPLPGLGSDVLCSRELLRFGLGRCRILVGFYLGRRSLRIGLVLKGQRRQPLLFLALTLRFLGLPLLFLLFLLELVLEMVGRSEQRS